MHAKRTAEAMSEPVPVAIKPAFDAASATAANFASLAGGAAGEKEIASLIEFGQVALEERVKQATTEQTKPSTLATSRELESLGRLCSG